MEKLSAEARFLVANVVGGLAVGDAIGNPLEFRQNITKAQVEAVKRAPLRISDDTQMTLFLMEQLSKGVRGPVAKASRRAYLRWYKTQVDPYDPGQGGLLGFHELFFSEAPGGTCLTACRAMVNGLRPLNASKGNGTVMRAAPFALMALTERWSIDAAMEAAMRDAEVTHCHPYAAHSSMFLVAFYWALHICGDATTAYADARARCRPFVSSSFLRDLQRVYERPDSFGGWVAEEALGMAIGFVAESTDYMAGVHRAAMIDGDSDTVASITGGLLGMLYGAPTLYCGKLVAKAPVIYAINQYCGG